MVPFANIAHGCNSVIATTTALKIADCGRLKPGRALDLGAEKFSEQRRKAGSPDCVVVNRDRAGDENEWLKRFEKTHKDWIPSCHGRRLVHKQST
jgi:formyltetrahydrofolate synthetase